MARSPDQPGGEVAQRGQGGEVAKRDPAVMAKFARMVTMIPEEDEGAADRIIDAILSADSWEDLDAPWQSTKVDALKGRPMRIDGVKRRPSDFTDGVGFFLVLNCTDATTGKETVIISSSEAVMAQIVRAYALRQMPLIVEFVVADRPTSKGYRPHHLKILASGAGSNGKSA